MSENPYKTPESESATRDAPGNVMGHAGFSLSLVGLAGITVVESLGPVISAVGVCLAFLCLPGVVVSGFGLFRTPKRFAIWGIGLGLLGSLCLPTLFLAVFVFPYR